MILSLDRSMTRAEYAHWRKQTRRIRRYGNPGWGGCADITSDRAFNTAAFERVGRRLQIEMRVHRNRMRLEGEARDALR